MTRDRNDQNIFALDMAGMRAMGNEVFAAATGPIILDDEAPVWDQLLAEHGLRRCWTPSDAAALAELAATYPSEDGARWPV